MNARYFPIILALIVLFGAAAYIGWPRSISADDFKKLVLKSDANSSSSWMIYKVNSEEYCFRHSEGLLPSRYCVSKSEIRLPKITKDTDLGYLRKGDVEVLAGRYSGARAERF